MAFYGGFVRRHAGGRYFYCGVRRLSFMKMADTACMGLVVAQIIGRWGDFFNRESFGEYTNSVLAMQLPLSSVRSGQVQCGYAGKSCDCKRSFLCSGTSCLFLRKRMVPGAVPSSSCVEEEKKLPGGDFS